MSGLCNLANLHGVGFEVYCMFGTPGVFFAPMEPDLDQLEASTAQSPARYICKQNRSAH